MHEWASGPRPGLVSLFDSVAQYLGRQESNKIYIADGGSGIYASGTYDIKGDGTGGKVNIQVNSSGQITKATVVSGGSGYTFGIVDLCMYVFRIKS